MPVDDHHHPAHGGNRASERAAPVAVVDDLTPEQEWLNQMRGWLLVVATIAAFATYKAGLNPPGGNPALHDNGHTAGDPLLHDRLVKQYLTFYYLNTKALATSLVSTIMLLTEQFFKSEAKLAALALTTMVGIMSLFGAFITGAMRDSPTSIYVIVLTGLLFVCVGYISMVLPYLCFFVLLRVPGLFTVAKKGWLPVTDNLKMRVESARKRRRFAGAAAGRRTGA